MDVADRSAVVTGAAGGIGAAVAEELLGRGARVVLTDLHADRLAATVDRLAKTYVDRVAGLPGDAASVEHLRKLLTTAVVAHGPVDLFVANAGVPGSPGLGTPEQWQRALDVNLMAHVRAARLLVPGWLERGEGRFVVTASAAGLLTSLGSVPYAVTKHAAVAFAEWLAATYGERGLAVHCICPQGVNTRMLANAGSRRGILTHDTALEPEQVAGALWDAMTAGEFLVLPHPQVRDYAVRRAAEHERWLAGMRKLQRRLDHPDPEEQ